MEGSGVNNAAPGACIVYQGHVARHPSCCPQFRGNVHLQKDYLCCVAFGVECFAGYVVVNTGMFGTGVLC